MTPPGRATPKIPKTTQQALNKIGDRALPCRSSTTIRSPKFKSRPAKTSLPLDAIKLSPSSFRHQAFAIKLLPCSFCHVAFAM
jgi:hypothetical protein